MASSIRVVAIGLVLVITILSIGTVKSQSSDCTNTIISMASCLNYIQGTSPTPPGSCCSALSNVVQTNPRCLCQVLDGGGSQFGISINVTRALSLPTACNVQTPPVSRCHDKFAPAPGPDGFLPSGSKATPGSDTSSATSSVTNTHCQMHLQVIVGFLVLLLVSSCDVSKYSSFNII